MGQYRPRYEYLLPEGPQWKIARTEKVSIFQETATKSLVSSSKAVSSGFEKPLDSLGLGAVAFHSQLPRPDLYATSRCEAIDAQLEHVNCNPSVSSTTRYFAFFHVCARSRMVALDRLGGHDPNLFKSTLTGIQYDPKFSTVRQRKIQRQDHVGLDTGAVSFVKMTERALSLSQKLPYVKNSINLDNVTRYYKQLDRDRSVPRFGSIAGRPREDDKDPLPSFLKVSSSLISRAIGDEQPDRGDDDGPVRTQGEQLPQCQVRGRGVLDPDCFC